MKLFYLRRTMLPFFMTMASLLANAQAKEEAQEKMLRIYEDNDFINILGHSTDKAYTNGTKIDYFYAKPERPGLLIDRLFPTAGRGSNNLLAWGITELMFTPNDLSVRNFQSYDYPYSTALFVTHGLYSYNPEKKISLQTEIMAGVRGPAALGEQTQTFIHRLIHFQIPMGWDNQLKNKPIINIRLTAEKQVYGYKNVLDILGGAEIYAGSFSTATVLYPVIRVGKMNPYFDGLINQYTSSRSKQHSKKKKIQAYLLFKPGVTFYAGNGMLQAGDQQFSSEGSKENLATIKLPVWVFNGGAVLAVNRVGISFNQNMTSALLQNLYAHATGNVSVYYRL